MSSSPLSLECRINRGYLRAERKAVVFVSADVQTKEARELSEISASNIVNLCMAIDCSGSMSGEKFETAKQAAIQIVGSLRPIDYISVIRFADEASIVVPRQKAYNKSEIQQRIQNMKLGSTTALYDGIKKSQKELIGGSSDNPAELILTTGIVTGFKKLIGRKSAAPSADSPSAPQSNELLGVSRLVLLSDGQPTAGPTDEGSFVELSKNARNSGITITALGIGEDYNEDLMRQIAAAAGGKWQHITPNDISKLSSYFANEITEMKTVMLVRPELRVHLMSGAELSNIYRVGNMVVEMTERDYRRTGYEYIIPLEDVRIGQAYRMVFNIHVPPKPEGTWRIARIALTATQLELTKDLVVESTNNQSLLGSESDPYPRTLLMLTQATVLSRKGVGDPTVAKQAQDLMQTVMKDPNAAAVIRQDRFLTAMGDTVIRVSEQTIHRKDLTEEDKKRLKGEATVIRR